MNPTDFLLLYQQLGLRPDSSIEELKLAYRRRVADLHPDRPRNAKGANAEVAGERLRQLTALYGSATAFHRRHGRLPGAGIAARPMPSPAPPAPVGRVGRPWTGRTLVLILAVMLGLACATWWLADAGDEGDAGGTGDEIPSTPAAGLASLADGDAAGLVLKLGLSRSDVLEIEKAPISQGDDRWDYGPSWIAFERGKVSGWYSSPLRPLRHATVRPPSNPDEVPPHN
jgi:hypothetical protein